MKQIIRDYFTFNKRERNGIFILILIIILLIVHLNFSNRFIYSEKIDFTKFEKEIQALNVVPVQKKKKSYKKRDQEQHMVPLVSASPERFVFNPNALPENDWRRLGLTDKQIHSIKNYESKGGKFRKKEDVKKMYAISDALYASLEPYIEIPAEKKEQAFRKAIPKTYTEIALLELNDADSVQLTTIKGIGPFFAKSIIKYKHTLGGYSSKEQLMEVWKFDEEKYKAVEKYITVDISKIKKININTCTAQELKHPYISWKIANGIVSYRSKHGNFTTLKEIQNTELLSDQLYLKLIPYLSLGN